MFLSPGLVGQHNPFPFVSSAASSPPCSTIQGLVDSRELVHGCTPVISCNEQCKVIAVGMGRAGLPGVLLPAPAELCRIQLHFGHVPAALWSTCVGSTARGQDTPFVLHHCKAGRPLRACCISMGNSLGWGMAGPA